MNVALSSLRVVTEGDSSSYVKSMADVASSSEKATESVGKFTDAQGNQVSYLSKTGDALSNATTKFERLYRSLDPVHAAQERLTQSQATLQSALDRGKISTELYNQLMAVAGQRFEDVGRKAGPLGKVFEGISGQLIALSAGAGPVGVTLAAFGPIGFAAAVGIGAATAAMGYLREEADKFGEKARKLNDFAETAGATAVQLQVLQHAGAGVGLATDALQQSFERFSVQLSELQKGSGTFYSELQKVNPALVLQLATTKDAAKAWDLLSRAYAEADVRQQALIAHAAFGRGGAGTGRLLTATAEAGGIGGLQSKMGEAELFDDATIQRVGALKTLLDESRKSTQDMMASMYAEQVLQGQVRFALKQKEITETIKESGTWWQRLLETMAMAQENPAMGQPLAPNPMDRARGQLATGLASNALTGGGAAWQRNIYQPPSYDQQQGPGVGPSAEFIANQYKATVAALGSAATAYEQQKAKVLELNVALKDHTLTETEYNRAVAALKLDTVIALEGQRLGLLGELAPVSEIVAQRENQIAAARTKGVDITKAEAKAISDLTRTQTEGARLQQQITLGVASEAQIRAQLANELRGDRAKGLYDPNNPEQLAAANVVLGKSFEKMSEQAKLARAPLEQLKKWEIDAGNFRLQVDTASVSVLNQMTTSIVDVASGAKSASQAFQDFGKSTIRILEEMIVKLLLARALSAALGVIGGGTTSPDAGNPGGSITSSGDLGAGGPAVWGHTGGMGYELARGPDVRPSVFLSAPRFHSGIGPNEMPAIIRRDEMVLTAGQTAAVTAAVMRAGAAMGGGGNNVKINIVNNSGSDVKTSKRREGNTDVHEVVIGIVNNAIAQGRMDGPLRARTGTQLQPRGR